MTDIRDCPDPLLRAFPKLGEPIFRRSTMRLGVPRIDSLQTDDGTASIVFRTVDMNRDTGGYNYLFRLATPSGDVEVNATVESATGSPAARKLAESGVDLWSLKTAEI